MYSDAKTPIEFSKDKKFARVRRYDDKNSQWWEVINIENISAITEHRVGKQVYSNITGKRIGYNVYVAERSDIMEGLPSVNYNLISLFGGIYERRNKRLSWREKI